MREHSKFQLINKLKNKGFDEDIMSQPDCVVYLNKQRHGNGKEGRWGFSFDSETFAYGEKW